MFLIFVLFDVDNINDAAVILIIAIFHLNDKLHSTI